jgi:hypothetical protein
MMKIEYKTDGKIKKVEECKAGDFIIIAREFMDDDKFPNCDKTLMLVTDEGFVDIEGGCVYYQNDFPDSPCMCVDVKIVVLGYLD